MWKEIFLCLYIVVYKSFVLSFSSEFFSSDYVDDEDDNDDE